MAFNEPVHSVAVLRKQAVGRSIRTVLPSAYHPDGRIVGYQEWPERYGKPYRTMGPPMVTYLARQIPSSVLASAIYQPRGSRLFHGKH